MGGFRELVKRRGLKVGTYLGEFATPGIGRMLKAADCDYAFVDMEHSGFSFETLKAILRNLHDVGIASVVRPPSKAYHHIARCLDVGAQGLVPPMMASAAEAQRIIDYMKYVPEGGRGVALGIAHDDYAPGPVIESLANANAKTALVPLIETAEGVENVFEIAALKNVNCLWVGHFDLSCSLGIPGQFTSRKFNTAIARVMEASRKHKKPVGRLAASAEECAKLHAAGCDFICYSGDIWLLQAALSSGVADIRARVAKAAARKRTGKR